MKHISKEISGTMLTLTAAILWGFSGCCGQYIFDNFHAEPQYLTAYRLSIAGALLVIYGFFTAHSSMIAIWKDKKAVIRLLIFAVFGIMLNSLSYLTAIAHTNSGTATILQYLGPLLVMLWTCFVRRRLPQKKEALAIILALLGTFFLATHGDIHTMVMTPLGLAWGLSAAFFLAAYTLIPVSIIGKYGSTAVTGYGMLIGGMVLWLITGSWNAPMIHDPICIIVFTAMVIFGTAITFAIYLLGVHRIGAVKASMLATVEPVSATVIMLLWLGEAFVFMDLVGFICIFITVFLLAKKEA